MEAAPLVGSSRFLVYAPGVKRFLREPLVHFLAIGAALFLFFAWRGGTGRIVVTRARIASLAAGFQRTWQRPPTAQEMKGMIDEYVREEAAVREAMATGLDRDDSIIRRRLKQKVDFLAEDRVDFPRRRRRISRPGSPLTPTPTASTSGSPCGRCA